MIKVGEFGLDSPGAGKGSITGWCELDNKCLEICDVGQRFSNCGPRTTSGPRVLPLWSF